MKAYQPFGFTTNLEQLRQRKFYADQNTVQGTTKAPAPPRDLAYSPGPSSALVTWKVPEVSVDIAGWDVARDTELNIVDHIGDPKIRKSEVTLTAGATPPVTNVFVRAVNALGVPSPWAQVQVKAAAQGAGDAPPPAPTAPPGYEQETSGGDADFHGGRNTL